MKSRKQAKFDTSQTQLANSSSSNSFVLKSIFSNIKKTFHKGENPQREPQQNLRKNKSSKQIIYRCGCVVIEPKIQNNCSIQFPLINSKIKTKTLSKLNQSKSLETFSKLKTNKTIETEKPSKQTIENVNQSQPRKIVKRVKSAEKDTELRKLMRKAKKLRKQLDSMQELEHSPKQRLKTDNSEEIIEYVPKETVRTVQKIKFVQKPIEKIIYSIQKVPKEVIKYKDIIVEVPVQKEQLVFVDGEPQEPIIKQQSVVKSVQKVVKRRNPENQAAIKQLAVKQRQCQNLEQIISDSLKEIQYLRSFIEIQVHNQHELARARSAEELLLQTVRRQANPEQLQSQTSITSNCQTLEKPRVSSFEIHQKQKITEVPSAPLIQPTLPTQTIQTTNTNVYSQVQTVTSEFSKRTPHIVRITSQGKMFVNGQATPSSGSSNIIRISADTRAYSTEPIASSSSHRQPTRVIRKYCKKNCQDICTCMSDLMVITTQQKS